MNALQRRLTAWAPRASGGDSGRAAPQPAAPGGAERRSRRWRAGVPLGVMVAGALFAVSANTADGTQLRAGPQNGLAQLARQHSAIIAALQAQVVALQNAANQATEQAARADAATAEATARAEPL
ncbi:MAG: hypothetical protein LBQ06_04910, partial [Frankiaceae bacterium]|nr:hypothetical protein [Frankiaceae bacterium]